MRLPSGPQYAQKRLLGTWEQSGTARRSRPVVNKVCCPAGCWLLAPRFLFFPLTLLDPEALVGPRIRARVTLDNISRRLPYSTLQPAPVCRKFLQQR